MKPEILEQMDQFVPSILLFKDLFELPLLIGGAIDIKEYMGWKEELIQVLPSCQVLENFSDEDFKDMVFLLRYIKEVSKNMKEYPGLCFHEEIDPVQMAKQIGISETVFAVWLIERCKSWFLN